MRKTVPVVAVMLLSLVACKKKGEGPPKPNVEQRMVEPRLGGDPDAEDDGHHLRFHITKIYRAQSLSEAAPFHQANGDWTFFDGALEVDPAAQFTVGVFMGKGNDLVTFGKTRMTVPSSAMGGHFVDAFAKAFAAKAVPASATPGTLVPFDFPLAVLGVGQTRGRGGGFTSKPGSWVASKWFPQDPDVGEGEVFFNYSLATQKGEWTEKDPDYASDLVALFAKALRDGPQPERTPENDSTLSLSGPVFGRETRIEGDEPMVLHFEDNTLLYTTKGELRRLDAATGKTELVMKVDVVDAARCEGDRCLVRALLPSGPREMRTDDSAKLWLVQRGKPSELLSTGAVDSTGCSIAPGLRYLAWNESDERNFIVVWDVQTRKKLEVVRDGKPFRAVGWTVRDGKPFISAEDGFEREPNRHAFDVDPATGAITSADRPLSGFSGKSFLQSPDGKRKVELKDDSLIFTDIGSGKTRTLQLHAQDARRVSKEALRWVSPRFLFLSVGRPTFIDSETLKVSFPMGKEKDVTAEITSDFSSALLHREAWLSVAPIVVK